MENEFSIRLAAEIVAAFVSNNSLPRSELNDLIVTVHTALRRLSDTSASAPAESEPLVPAVSIRKSVTADYLICLEDGKRFKSLKRHLATLGLTPEQYRDKWSLPADYPMVAPGYSAKRSALAKGAGFGKPREAAADA